MLYSKSTNSVIMLPGKVASRSLLSWVIEYYPDCIDILHLGHIHAKFINEFVGAANVTTYSLYRCPVQRFVSLYAFVHSGKHSTNKSYTDISISQFIDILSEYIEYYYNPTKPGNFEVLDLGAPQTAFFSDNTILLDMYDMDSSLRILVEKLKLPSRPYSVPVINTTNSKKYLSLLTSEEIKRIQNLYHKDYEFFNNRNIKFDLDTLLYTSLPASSEVLS